MNPLAGLPVFLNVNIASSLSGVHGGFRPQRIDLGVHPPSPPSPSSLPSQPSQPSSPLSTRA